MNGQKQKSGNKQGVELDQRPGQLGNQSNVEPTPHGNQPDRAHKEGEQDQRPGQK
jgi:hypothetical protein